MYLAKAPFNDGSTHKDKRLTTESGLNHPFKEQERITTGAIVRYRQIG